MSGRRVRIKGVANIPVRRKNEITNEKKVNDEVGEKQDGQENGKRNSSTDIKQPEISPEKREIQKEDILKIKNKAKNNGETTTTTEISSKKDLPTTKNLNTDAEISSPRENKIDTSENEKRPLENKFKRWTSRPSVKIPSMQRKIKASNEDNVSSSSEISKPIEKNDNSYPEIIDKVAEKSQSTEPCTENIVKSVTFDSSTNFDNVNNSISPNKLVNRARIKPVPRFNIRRNSFHGSASESEDDSRKTQNRTRNDSVCSIGNLDTPGKEDNNVNKEKQTKVLSQRKIRYTDQSRKLATAKREFQLKFGSQNPDRKRLTMMDLIFYNPTTNPMSEKPSRKNSVEIADPIQLEEEKEDDPKNISDSEDPPVPQVKVGPDGEIILDEQSLVIEQTGTKRAREQIENSQIIIDDLDTGYGVYKKPKRCKDWTFAETLRFYRTLNTVGTDFSLMLGLFPGRTRRELKMKFKKEEKYNRMLIDKVLMNPLNFNLTELEEQLQNEKDEDDIFNKKIEIDKSLIKRRKTTKTSVLSREIDDENQIEIKRKRVPSQKDPKNKLYSTLQKGIDSIIDTSDSEDYSISLKNENLNNTIEVNVTSNERPTRICRLRNPSNFEKCFESDNSDNELNLEAENQKLISKQLQKVGTVVEKMIKLKNKNILENEVIEVEEDDTSFIENETEEMVDTNIVIAHSENAEPDQISINILSKNATEEGVQNTETKVSLQVKNTKEELQIMPEKNLEVITEKELTKSVASPKILESPVKEKSTLKNLSLQSLTNMEPGSLMIMSSLNAKGENVYKVFMVTPENEKIPIDLSDDIIRSLTALEEQEKEEEEISID